MIYCLIESNDYSSVKIGSTCNLKQRIGMLQVGNPKQLQLIAVLDGTTLEEREIHTKFKEYQLRGEWFKLEGKLLEYLKPHLLNYKPAATVFMDILKDELDSVIVQYVQDKAKVSVSDILENCFKNYNTDLTNKQLQYRVSLILKQLNYIKKHTNKANYWIKNKHL